MMNNLHKNTYQSMDAELRATSLERNLSASKSMLIVLMVISALWIVLAFSTQDIWLIIHAISSFSLLALAYLLIRANKHLLGRVLFLFFSHLIIFSDSVLVGEIGNVDVITIAGFGIVFLIFNYTWEWRWIKWSIAITFLNLIGQKLWFLFSHEPYIHFSSTEANLINILGFITALSVLIVLIYNSLRSIANGETAIKDLIETKVQLSESEKMASLGQLTAGVAHEINNPINAINGSITGIERKMKGFYALLDGYSASYKSAGLQLASSELVAIERDLQSESTRKLLFQVIEDIKVGSDRIVKIVSGLKKFSRGISDQKTKLNLHEGINETLMLLRNSIKPGTIVETNFDSNITEVKCYGYELNQVIMNLISNADQAIEKDGVIQIETKDRSDAILIMVKDNGVGMDEDVIRKIFTPFYTTKPIGEGTGLGLAISYGIIQKHGGEIKVKSSPGKGTEFMIVLPKVRFEGYINYARIA
jgi:signal transduction histidine kinase